MKIHELTLPSTHLDQQQTLFSDTLGFECVRTDCELRIEAGRTILRFVESCKQFYYHYCFLIPTGCMESVCRFLDERCFDPLLFHGNRIVPFGSTGQAVYFHDADGNIAEFIERPSLGLPVKNSFEIGDVVCLNEIGIPTEKPKQQAQSYIERYGIELADGVVIRDDFVWCGDYEGVFLLPVVGRNWMPCEKSCEANNLKIKFETKKGHFELVLDEH